MASVGGASDAIPEYYGKETIPSPESTQEFTGSQFFLFLWSLISGQYNDSISQNMDKITGVVSMTWKFFVFFAILLIFVGWWFGKRNQRIQRYRELKNK